MEIAKKIIDRGSGGVVAREGKSRADNTEESIAP